MKKNPRSKSKSRDRGVTRPLVTCGSLASLAAWFKADVAAMAAAMARSRAACVAWMEMVQGSGARVGVPCVPTSFVWAWNQEILGFQGRR